MSEYTPTPNEARADFITLRTRNFDAYQVGRSLTSEQEFYGAQYDRMIAAIEREAAARALDRVGQDSRLTDAARDGMNQHGPFPWCAAEGVGEFLRARAAEIRKGDL